MHEADATSLLPKAFFDNRAKSSGTDSSPSVFHLTNLLPRLSLHSNAKQAPTPAGKGGKHLFAIVAKMIKDPRLDPRTLKLSEQENRYETILKTSSDVIREYADQWDVSAVGQDPSELEGKIEELYWTQTLAYGVGGWSKEHGFRADFFS